MKTVVQLFLGAILVGVVIGVAVRWSAKSEAEAASHEHAVSAAVNAGSGPASAAAPVEAKKPKEVSGEDAYYFARQACEKALKAPSTAKFSSPRLDEHTGWQKYGFGQWQVFGWVDAQNSFGVPLRNNWLAIVSQHGEMLELDYLRLGDDEVGQKPKVATAPLSPEFKKELADRAAKSKADGEAAALKYHQELADQGDPYGMFKMGMRYLTGDGVAQDPRKARDLLARAAAKGQKDAQEELSKLPPQTADK